MSDANDLPVERMGTVVAGAHTFAMRGHEVLVDGHPVVLTTRQAAVLAALIDSGGRVLSRAELLARAWPDELAEEHAVEMTIGRLRNALGSAAAAIETVVKRGYRLAAPVGEG